MTGACLRHVVVRVNHLPVWSVCLAAAIVDLWQQRIGFMLLFTYRDRSTLQRVLCSLCAGCGRSASAPWGRLVPPRSSGGPPGEARLPRCAPRRSPPAPATAGSPARALQLGPAAVRHSGRAVHGYENEQVEGWSANNAMEPFLRSEAGMAPNSLPGQHDRACDMESTEPNIGCLDHG